MNCPFCGTDVPKGYTVCTRCHAFYREEKISGCRPAIPMLTGLALILGSPMLGEASHGKILPALITFLTGCVMFYFGRKRLVKVNKSLPVQGKWYRQHYRR